MSAGKEASAKQTFTFQAMGYGIMHHEVMIRRRKLAWILRQQNHYAIAGNQLVLNQPV